ncbi:cell wall-binding repeat-containing protein [Bacillus sp. JJ1521]|uniref:cell wall-binding repeat-containing protein n=1 Tax=Bacillus sp. JJ1521 TaxID=3122957 RepID=UPI003000ECB8
MRKIQFLIILSILLVLNVDIAKAETNLTRIDGKDRFEVAVNVSQTGWGTSSTVIIAFYNAYADALAAGPLAYNYDAPILLTHKDKLTPVTKNEISRLKANKVVVVGGAGSVSDDIMRELRNMGIKSVWRIGGKDRYEVAENIAAELPAKDSVILASGLNFSDALAISPYASENGFPILLTRKDSIPDETKAALSKSSIKYTFVIGGEGSISRGVYFQVKNELKKGPSRIGGKDRYEVAANIIERFGYNTDKAYLSTGLTFADALTGSVLAAKNKAPILLTSPTYVSPATQSAIFENQMFNLTVLGGTGSVPQNIVANLINIGMVIAKPSNGNATVNFYSGSQMYDWQRSTYVSPGTEMKYISVDSSKVKVQLANREGWVKSSEVSLIPSATMNSSRSYYISNGTDLIHVVKGVQTIVGKAPSFINTNQKYYSLDGVVFYNASNQKVGEFEQYFQLKSSIVSKTSYSRDQLLSYVNSSQELKDWERKMGRINGSPLRDPEIIDAMLAAQDTYNINALFILAAAIHESAWGVSDIAFRDKNLFGIKVHDSNPTSGEIYNKYVDSINQFAKDYMKDGYTNPNSWKNEGPYPGHKGIGVNVWYASDPNWGSRVAGHMYKIDKALGSKEIK